MENGEYILYNTMSGAMLLVDEDTKNTIESIQETDLPEDKLKDFRLNGVIIGDEENELLKFRDRFNARRYNQQDVSFYLAPVSSCNLSCEYCFQRAEESPTEEKMRIGVMSESMTKNVLTFVKRRTELCNANVLPLSFYGGEPLMTKELILYILKDLEQWSKEHSLEFYATTYSNCTLFDQSLIEEMRTHGMAGVRTTLDGPQEIHDQYRFFKNGKGTYEVVVTTIGELMDAGIDVEIQVNINRQYKHAPELFDDLAERGLKGIGVTSFPLYDPKVVFQQARKLYGHIPEDVPIPESRFAVPFWDIPEARLYVYKCAHERGFTLYPPNLGCLVPCHGVKYYHYVVDLFGYVYKCVASMLIKSMQIGQIHENGEFERFPFLFDWMNNDPSYLEKCESCKLLPTCAGGCVYGRKLIQLSHMCEVSQFYGEDYIKMYLKQKYPEKFKSLKIT